MGTEIAGKALGLIGLGHLGKAVATRCRLLGMNVLAYDAVHDNEFAELNSHKYTILYEILRQSDFVSLHLPLTESTRHMIDIDAPAKTKRTAFLVNTSRGEILDEQALYSARKVGMIAGTALDVYETEPPTQGNPLFALGNCACTPHIGAHTSESVLRNNLEAVRKVVEVLKRQPQ